MERIQKLGIKPNQEHVDLITGSGGLHAYENFARARNEAAIRAGLTEDSIPFLQEKGPYKDKIYTGMQSLDETRGWRLDFDPTDPSKAVHINWWFKPDLNQPRVRYKGMIKIDKATQDIYWDILSHFPKHQP